MFQDFKNVPLLQNTDKLMVTINKVFDEILQSTKNLPKGESVFHAK